jgi:hypothetical protein
MPEADDALEPDEHEVYERSMRVTPLMLSRRCIARRPATMSSE